MFRFGDPGGRMSGTAAFGTGAWWTSTQANNMTVAISAGNGRTTGSCIRFGVTNANGTQGSLSKTLDSQATWGVAAAFRGPLPSSNNLSVISLLDTSSLQCDLRFNNNGDLFVTRNGTQLGSTVPGVWKAGVWIHLEFRVHIDPSAGTVYVGVNGTQVLNLTGLNTRNTANSSANQVQVGPGINGTPSIWWFQGGNFDVDDVIVYDGQTTDSNGLADITGPIGDCGLTWLLPSGAGTTTQFTPTPSATANYACVNEATPDGDTTYAASSTVGQIDTYAMTDLPNNINVVKSLAVCHYARRDNVNSRGVAAELRVAGTNYTATVPFATGTNYQYYFTGFGSNPATTTAWAASDVNALEAGQKVIS